MLKKLKVPVRLIHPNLKTVEIIDNIEYLKYQTQLGVKEQALLNCIVEDNENNYHKITGIIDLEPKGPWWRFEFFNPMKRVELKFSLIADDLTLAKIKKVLSKKPR